MKNITHKSNKRALLTKVGICETRIVGAIYGNYISDMAQLYHISWMTILHDYSYTRTIYTE